MSPVWRPRRHQRHGAYQCQHQERRADASRRHRAITVLVVLLVASPLAKHVPLPALAAILMWVAMNMGEWREFKALRQYTPLRNAT